MHSMLPSLNGKLTSGPVCASLTQTLPCTLSLSPTPIKPGHLQAPMPSEIRDPAAETAAAHVSALERAARRHTTPCGTGVMVWRAWGTGDPLVLLHGGYGSWTHWIRAIPPLSQHYELWVPDIPGLGDSAMPPEPWTPASIAEVVRAGLDET